MLVFVVINRRKYAGRQAREPPTEYESSPAVIGGSVGPAVVVLFAGACILWRKRKQSFWDETVRRCLKLTSW
jgi:hypothetical protein